MKIIVFNAQQKFPVNSRAMIRLLRCAIRMLKIVTPGVLEVTFLSPQRMRAVNRQALHHDRVTDVISFRYQDEPVAGEIFVAPSEAHRYAKEHGIPYEQELARYVLHGLLHWLGHDDRTPAQQRTMRMMEDRLLTRCDGNSHG